MNEEFKAVRRRPGPNRWFGTILDASVLPSTRTLSSLCYETVSHAYSLFPSFYMKYLCLLYALPWGTILRALKHWQLSPASESVSKGVLQVVSGRLSMLLYLKSAE
jgi:hypothetical protein